MLSIYIRTYYKYLTDNYYAIMYRNVIINITNIQPTAIIIMQLCIVI